MKRIRYFLLGKHSNRTPLAYDIYKKACIGQLEECSRPEDANVLVTGFIQDYKQYLPDLLSLKKTNKSLKLIVISEEPLWDSLWSGLDYKKKWTRIAAPGREEASVNIFQVNHYNSNIFNFRYIPYFLSTEHKYISRYSQMRREVFSQSQSSLRSRYLNKTKDLAGILERRVDSKFTSDSSPELSLSVYRSKLAELASFSSGSISKAISCDFMGKGWLPSNTPRQQIGDWHLDKLIRLRQGYKAVLAIENTISPFYITEKLFDAVFALARPVHCLDSQNMKALSYVINLEAVGINLNGTSAEEGLEIIRHELSNPDESFGKAMLAIHHLSKLCGPLGLELIHHEVKWRSARLVDLIKSIL